MFGSIISIGFNSKPATCHFWADSKLAWTSAFDISCYHLGDVVGPLFLLEAQKRQRGFGVQKLKF